MSSTQFNTILPQLLTTEDTAYLQQALVILKQHNYGSETAPELTDILKNTPLSTIALIRPFIGTTQRISVDEFIVFLEQLPVATLTLSYLPTQTQAAALVKLLRSKLDKSLIVHILYNQSVGLGFNLDFGGKSVAHTIDITTYAT